MKSKYLNIISPCFSYLFDYKMEDVLVYFGSSQTGKSSTLKLLTGDDSVVCGDYGKRSSTTYDIRIYR
jgi:GTP-binding protein EngB required for normal cell division